MAARPDQASVAEDKWLLEVNRLFRTLFVEILRSQMISCGVSDTKDSNDSFTWSLFIDAEYDAIDTRSLPIEDLPDLYPKLLALRGHRKTLGHLLQ